MNAYATALSLFLALTLTAAPAHAETEIEAWYLSKGDEHLVRESIHGNLHALLSLSNNGEPSVYIIMSDEDCKTESSDIHGHNPLYINSKLVQFSQYCEGERRYFFPTTEAGRRHLVGEFLKSQFVEIKTHTGDTTFLFSAKGFSKVYRDTQALSEAI